MGSVCEGFGDEDFVHSICTDALGFFYWLMRIIYMLSKMQVAYFGKKSE